MKNIIIAGAGFAGVRAALDLAKNAPADFKIILINDTKYHSFHADLYEVATAIMPYEKRQNFHELESTTNIPLHKIFEHTKVELVIDKLDAVYIKDRIVSTKSHKFKFDYLVLALGSTTHYFGVKGAEEFSHPLKTTEDAINIRDDIEELVINSSSPITIAIAGGSFTGVEFAGDVMHYLQNLARVHNRQLGKAVIIESSASVLNGMPKWASDAATKRFKDLNVTIETNSHIEEVLKDRVICQNGKEIPYNYLIWVTGITCKDIKGDIASLPKNKKGQYIVKSDLSIENYPNIFIAGDLACIMDENKKIQIPSTARNAYAQGATTAKNIILNSQNKNTIVYKPQESVFVVPIGGKYGLANLWGLHVSGPSVWLLKRYISLKYLTSILPISKSFTLWRKGVKIYFNND